MDNVHVFNTIINFERTFDGCLNIVDKGDGDIIHVCNDAIPDFLTQLSKFIDRTDNTAKDNEHA